MITGQSGCRPSGLDVRAWLRGQDRLRRLPVVMLTSSRESADVNRAHDLGVNSYLVKPVEFAAPVDLVRTLRLYWVVMSEPPDVRA